VFRLQYASKENNLEVFNKSAEKTICEGDFLPGVCLFLVKSFYQNVFNKQFE